MTTTIDLTLSLDKWAAPSTTYRDRLAYIDGWTNCRNAHIARAAMSSDDNCGYLVRELEQSESLVRSLIDNIERHGNYTPESTVNFLRQIKQGIDAAIAIQAEK